MKFHKHIIFLISSLMLSACSLDSSSDFDSDGDGMIDKKDACPFDPNKFIDAGECGCGNTERIINGEVRCIYNTVGDNDNDGVVDKEDECPNKPFKYHPGICGCDRYDLDEDGDGAIDACETLPEDADTPFTPPTFPDLCPQNAKKILPGTCGCDVEDLDIDHDGYTDGCSNTNSGILIFPDQCENDSNKHVPGICGCGTPDTDSDGDKVSDCLDGCPTDPTKIAPLVCGCGVPDTDTDGDGTPDCIDACPNDPDKIVTKGFCGCNVPETDTDGDGTPDCIDECPIDPNKTQPGVCGCFFSDADLNDNGLPDCEEKFCPDDTLKVGQEPGICGCDTPDDDTDDDGVVDCIDVCPNNPDKSMDVGICGCDLNDSDSDGDGTIDCFDPCPDDPNKTDPMQCGCGNDEYDLDGDGTADCVDECPDDPTQSVKGECGCGLHPIIETVLNATGEETTISICPAPGGLLSLDRMYPGINMNESGDQNGAMQRYLQRTSPNHVLEAYFVPGGNVLIDPNLENVKNAACSDSEAWQCSDSTHSVVHCLTPFTDEVSDPRPFPQYRVLVGSHFQTDDGVIKQEIPNPYFSSQDVTVRYGVFGSTTYKDGTDKLAINNKSFTCDQNVFRFFTTTETLSSDQERFTAAFYTIQGSRDPNDGSNAHGAAIQGFQVFFGDPQVRFSTDGEHWTDWMTQNDDMWKTQITLPEGYGYRYAYMQTRNATLPVSVEGEDPASNISSEYVYYETSNRILLKAPNRDAHLQINTFKPSEDLDDLAAINAALDARSTASKSVTLLYTPGTNLLTDPTFQNTKASKWIVQNANSTWALHQNTLRAFPRLPELVAANGHASFTQRQPIDKNLQSQPFEVGFWVLQNDGDTINAQIEMYDKNGIILDYGIKKVKSCQSFGNDTNIKYCSLKANFLDDVYSYILNVQSDSTNATGPRFQAFRVGAGNTVVRFSNDRQTWSNWESANGIKNWTLDHCTPIEGSTSQACTVIMQSYDVVTRTYAEASDTILYTP